MTNLKTLSSNFINSKSEKDFELFYNACYPVYYGLIRYKYRVPIADVPLLVDNIMLNIYSHISAYNPSYAFNTWAGTIMQNEVYMYFRNKKKSRTLHIDDKLLQIPELNEEELIKEYEDLISKMIEVVNQLDDPHKSLLVDKYINNLTLKDMADKYDTKVQIIKNGLVRARKFAEFMFKHKGCKYKLTKIDILTNKIKKYNGQF